MTDVDIAKAHGAILGLRLVRVQMLLREYVFENMAKADQRVETAEAIITQVVRELAND